MSVLDSQQVGRRTGNRRVRQKTSLWDTLRQDSGRWRATQQHKKVKQQPRVAHRRQASESGSRAAATLGTVIERVLEGMVDLLGMFGGLLMACGRWSGIAAMKCLMFTGTVLVTLAAWSWAAALWALRLLGAGIIAATPHVLRGVVVSAIAGRDGAKASAKASVRISRHVAVQTQVRMRNQADYMKDGMPDVRSGMSDVRQGAHWLRRLVARALLVARKRGWLSWPGWRPAFRAAGTGLVMGGTGVAVAAAALFGPPAVQETDALDVQEIAVSGGSRVPVEDILRAAAVEEGDNLTTIDLERVADDVRALPWIESVSLRRRYPDRFVITVVERQPALILADGDLWFVDHHGEVFKRVESGEWMDLPLVTGLTLEDRVNDPDGSRDRLVEAVRLTQVVEESSSLDSEDIGELRLDADGFGLLTSREGVALHLDAAEYRTGLERLDTLLERDLLSLNAVSSVDLALSNQVVATRKVEL